MNITFENGSIKAHSNADRVTTSNMSSHVKETSTRGAFALDISGTVMDNTAYEGHGKTAEDVMQNAGQIDVATQKNYMAVMSNTMSEEDFARLQEEGYHPGNTDIETVVTIVDEIKAALAKGGKDITGFTDDLDVETLTQITGSAGFANELVKQFDEYDIPVTKENVEDVLSACATAAQVGSMNDGMIKYMVCNQMEPSLANCYKARYSATADADKQGKGYYQDTAGYYAKKADNYNWQQLMPQMEKVIENSGFEVSEETLKDARWLVEKGVELTEESFRALYELKKIEIPESMEQLLPAAAAAIADGKSAKNANLADAATDLEKAQSYLDIVNSISDEAVDQAAAEGKILNLRNLQTAQLQVSISYSADISVSVSGRRQLEEVRLQMSVQANLTLIRSGFSIDTAELSQLVDELKAAEAEHQQVLFGDSTTADTAKRAELYQETLSKVKMLPFMPAAVVGKFAFQSSTSVSYTIDAVYTEGSTLRSAYEKAGESYEALMTAPRADLGDSIQKAFRNVEDILKDINAEATEENKRAVRILGYNRMEISEESITAVKSTDLTIKRVTEKMTPASTLQMIREGVNPLSVNMEELETYLDNQEKEPSQNIEKYSEFLYRLEKNNGITEEERDAYIGIYRLFRQLEKTDGAAIGTLVNQGVEPTVKNLLSAMRSNKRHGMDVTVDDSFGGVTASYQGKSISEQIETAYYSKLSGDIFDNLDGGRMPQQITDMTLEELAAALREEKEAGNAESGRIESEYRKQQMNEMREAGKTEDSVIKELLEFDQPITTDNLLAAGLLRKERGKFAEKMNQLAEQTGEEEQLEEIVNHLHESMTGETEAKAAYEKLEQKFTDILEEAVYGQENRIDIRGMNSLYKQVSLTGNMAKEENYEVPVDINGEITSINLKIVHNQKENGKVIASMQSESYGRVTAQFQISEQQAEGADAYQLSGYIVCDSSEGLASLKQSGEMLKKVLEQTDINVVSLNFIYHQGITFSAASERMLTGSENNDNLQTAAAGSGEVSTKKLYETAKIFIGYIQKGEGISNENQL